MSALHDNTQPLRDKFGFLTYQPLKSRSAPLVTHPALALAKMQEDTLVKVKDTAGIWDDWSSGRIRFLRASQFANLVIGNTCLNLTRQELEQTHPEVFADENMVERCLQVGISSVPMLKDL
eukprot:2677932-Rhodomonas_salina.2